MNHNVELMSAALREFVDTINATGGVVVIGGIVSPVGDADWSDLGSAYLRACVALGELPICTDGNGDVEAYGENDV